MRVTAAENFNMAMDSVWKNRFRSGLTILGIVIGITTVVTVSSLLTGLRQGIVDFFQEFGPDNIFISRFTGDPSAPPHQPTSMAKMTSMGRAMVMAAMRGSTR